MVIRSLALFCSLFLMAPGVTIAEDKPRGEIKGGVPHNAPGYFKESFLEIADDVDEATDSGKHVMLFFQLNACPYCDRMLTESFEADPNMSFIKEHFDTIAINTRGDREVVFNEDTSVQEKELAEMLKVRATPAILFLDANNQPVVRVNGYRAPERFATILRYVNSKAYETTTLADYMEQHLEKGRYEFLPHPLFKDETDLASIKGPLMVMFEDSSCIDCPELHERTLSRDDVQEQMKKFTVVRLDADSEQTITAPDGSKTSPKAFARDNDMLYRPGIMLFDEGKLVRRYDSLIFPFHFREGLRYVADGFHRNMEYRQYSEQRREELLSSGVDIDLGR